MTTPRCDSGPAVAPMILGRHHDAEPQVLVANTPRDDTGVVPSTPSTQPTPTTPREDLQSCRSNSGSHGLHGPTLPDQIVVEVRDVEGTPVEVHTSVDRLRGVEYDRGVVDVRWARLAFGPTSESAAQRVTEAEGDDDQVDDSVAAGVAIATDTLEQSPTRLGSTSTTRSTSKSTTGSEKSKTSELSADAFCCVCFAQFEEGWHPKTKLACRHPVCILCSRRIIVSAMIQKQIARCPICRCAMTEMQDTMVSEMREKGARWMLSSCGQAADAETLSDLEAQFGVTRDEPLQMSEVSKSTNRGRHLAVVVGGFSMFLALVIFFLTLLG